MPIKILIIKPSSLGDVVHTLPAVGAIRDAQPDAEITWVINSEWATLLRGNPDVDHLHIFPRSEFRRFGAPAELFPWIRETRRLRPDAAIDFQGLLRSALIAKVSRAKKIYGMNDGREGSRLFYNQIALVDRNEHAVDRYLIFEPIPSVSHSVGRCAPAVRSVPRFRCFASLRSRPPQIDLPGRDPGILSRAGPESRRGRWEIASKILAVGELRRAHEPDHVIAAHLAAAPCLLCHQCR